MANKQKEFLRYLIDTSRGEIPLLVSHKGTYIYSVFLPKHLLKGDYIDDLMRWDCRPEDTWSYNYSPGKHGALKSVPVLSPYHSSKSKLLRHATPITIVRSFIGMTSGPKSYMVINQLLSHPNDLHFEKERGAYCRLNEDGGVEEVVRIRHTPDETFVSITQEVLDKHLFLTKSVLIRFFNNKLSVSETKKHLIAKKNKIYFRHVAAGELRGFQVIASRLSRRESLNLLKV